jgi:RNA polymerase sigma-70 factor (ECF subfamily)
LALSGDYLPGEKTGTRMATDITQDERYRDAAAAFAPALDRLARAYEADPEHRRDLLQEIHVALWRSFAGFDGRCSLRTWVYRVAHNVATSHVLTAQRRRQSFTTLEALEEAAAPDDPEAETGRKRALDRLTALIQELAPSDRQVALLYLEDLDAAAIGEVTGLSAGAVAVRIHRLKAVLAARFNQGRVE